MSSLEENLQLWSGIDEGLRSLVLGKITCALECVVCSELMHVPLTLACGHSFCYECLNTWLDNKLTCPTCRFDLEQPPVVNVQLRNMSKSISDVLIETDDKLKHQREEAIEAYERDLTSGKLFGDIFERSVTTLIDRTDGVPRCGNCHWEAHGSVCLHCGTRFRIERDDDYYDSDDGEAYNEDDEEVAMYGDDRYDSEDSFVDNRGLEEINNSTPDNSDILSGSQSPVEWEGFTENNEINEDNDDLVELAGEDLSRALEHFNEEDEGLSVRGRRRRNRIIEDDSD